MKFWTPSGLSESSLKPGPAALVIAHPGHELRVHGWVEWARPTVFVLTDGSGHCGHSRIPSTTRLLRGAGASNGSVFGRFTDRELYNTILERRMPLFTALVTELSSAFVAARFEYVVADAAEGYNPTHDLCRLIVDAAVECARGGLPETFKSFEIDLTSAPDAAAGDARVFCLTLDAAAFERKLSAARAYVEMAQEVDAALERWGASAFRHEHLRETSPDVSDQQLLETPPYYERHGELRRGEGTYEQVIRYREHIRPVREALRKHVATIRCQA